MKSAKTSSASRLAKQLESVSLAEDPSAQPGVTGPRIVATSQQSRFHSATLELTSNLEVDLTTVNISIGDREILVDAKVAFRAGVRYALTGRNGTGKSSECNLEPRTGFGEKVLSPSSSPPASPGR
jgi:ABC-type molybdenum transport system ATPase subunit/photorepair protein PhrA